MLANISACMISAYILSLFLSKLHLLLIQDTKWKTISIVFIIELLEFMEFNMIITVINSVSKRTHFILVHIIIIVESAIRLFLYI